jgi:hypothetical protein
LALGSMSLPSLAFGLSVLTPPFGSGTASPLPLERLPPSHLPQTLRILTVQLVPPPWLKLFPAAHPQAGSRR